VINVADPVAFISHDLDDGLRSGILREGELRRLKIYQAVGGGQAWIRKVIPFLVHDVIDHTRARIEALKLSGPEEARQLPELVVGFSPRVRRMFAELHEFLFQSFYHHFRVLRMRRRGIETVRLLWQAFTQDPRLLPPDTAAQIEERTAALPPDLPLEERERREERIPQEVVRDYIAGMTDRFAFRTAAELAPPGALPSE
jgi:dGTPase